MSILAILISNLNFFMEVFKSNDDRFLSLTGLSFIISSYYTTSTIEARGRKGYTMFNMRFSTQNMRFSM